MAFQPIYNEIDLTLKKPDAKDRVKTECKTEIPSDSVSKILNLTAHSVVTECENSETGIRYSGKINFFVCYVNKEGEVCKCECSSDFNGVISGVKDCQKPVVNSVTEKIEADVSGVRLNLSAIITVSVRVCECKKFSALTGGDDLIINSNEISVSKSCGIRENVFPVEEEFEINGCVKEVLSQRANVVVTSVQSGVGCIIVDGNLYLSAILLQNNEKNDIIRESKVMPFRAEIECEDAMPSMTALAEVKVKSLKTDITVDTERGKSSVNACVVLLLSGEVYYTDTLNIVSDAFVLTENVELEKETHDFYKPCSVMFAQEQIDGKCVIDELPVGVSLLAVFGEKTEIAECERTENGLTLSGTLAMTVFFKDLEGKVFTRKAETPYSVNISQENVCEAEYSVCAVVSRPVVKMLSATELELFSTLDLTLYPWQKDSVCIAKSVKSLGEKPYNDFALSVYIPCEGEELWSLAKRLNVCPDTLVSTNPDLKFPLSGDERIVVYRQR